MEAPTTTERLRRDVANAEVYAPGVSQHLHRRARAFVTSERVIVWTMGENRQPVKLLEEEITGEPPEANRGTLQGTLTVRTTSGTIHINRGGGCGCGSTLTALDPPVGW